MSTSFTVLAPYKYSGYPMLIKTMEMEIADEQLFAKEEPLLASSAEVVYHTLNCSSLNVEELRREKGTFVLMLAKISSVDAFINCLFILQDLKCFSGPTIVVFRFLARVRKLPMLLLRCAYTSLNVSQ